MVAAACTKVFLTGVHNDFPARYKFAGRGYHTALFCCLWCIFQGMSMEGAVRFLGYLTAAAQSKWHKAFNPKHLRPDKVAQRLKEGKELTAKQQAAERTKAAVASVLRNAPLQCTRSACVRDAHMRLTDKELKAMYAAVDSGDLPKQLTGIDHNLSAAEVLGDTFSVVDSIAVPPHHAVLLGAGKNFMLRVAEVEVRKPDGGGTWKFKNALLVRSTAPLSATASHFTHCD